MSKGHCAQHQRRKKGKEREGGEGRKSDVGHRARRIEEGARALKYADRAGEEGGVAVMHLRMDGWVSAGEEDGRKKRKRAEVEGAPQDDAPSVPSKHSGVLDKFQKAARLSEAQKAAAKDRPVEAEEQPELHGL